MKTLTFTISCREPNLKKISGVTPRPPLGQHALYANVPHTLQLSSVHESYGPALVTYMSLWAC